MPSDDPQTFECTTCEQKHDIISDTLPVGHSGHKPHCILCSLHTLYRATIPAAPSARPTGAQIEKNNIIRTRKIILGIVILIAILAFLSFRWQMQFWTHIINGTGHGQQQGRERFLWFTLCMIFVAPCGTILGFVISVMYYIYWCLKKKKTKRRKASQQPGAVADAQDEIPLEQKPLTELRYQDLREMKEQIQIVVTPPDEPEMPQVKENRMSKMLGAVTNRFTAGYDGRDVRKQNWIAMEEMGGLGSPGERGNTAAKASRPVTEWPAI